MYFCGQSHFFTSQQGVAIGWTIDSQYNQQGTVVATPDGGVTWNLSSSLQVLNGAFFGGSFLGSTDWWLCGQQTPAGASSSVGVLAHTTDGGSTWSQSTGPPDSAFNDVGFVDATDGWLSSASGTIYRTYDGGTTWNAEDTGYSYLSRISAVSVQNIWVVGLRGTILHYPSPP